MMTHDYSKLWALAPSWARWIATTFEGDIWFFENRPTASPDGGWDFTGEADSRRHNGNGPDWKNSLQEIPERERRSNRWVDTYKTWGGAREHEALIWHASAITEPMFNERRRIRIEAGLIEGEPVEDDGVAAALDEMANINQETGQYDIKEGPLIKPDTDNGEGWNGEVLPGVGTQCLFRNKYYEDGDWAIVEVRYSSDQIVVLRSILDQIDSAFNTLCRNDEWFIRPLRKGTPDQKAEREAELKKMADICWKKSGEFSRKALEALYDAGCRLKSEGEV